MFQYSHSVRLRRAMRDLAAMVEAVPNAFAFGNLSGKILKPRKWSPWEWVM
jgi:hypothetical protein